MINTTGKLASFCAFRSPPAPSFRIHWPQFSRHSLLATISYDPPPLATAIHQPPNRPTAELSKVSKTERDPISTSGPSIFSMSPNRAIPAGKSNFSSPLAAAQPLTILSWPEALNVTGSRRACRMAMSHNVCSLLLPHSSPPLPRHGPVVVASLATGEIDARSAPKTCGSALTRNACPNPFLNNWNT
jgi:hypothetical protein